MDFMIAKLFGFVMVATRISTFFLLAPVFSWKAVPVRVKVATTVFISIFFTMISPSAVKATDISPMRAVLFLANEATYGLALGFVAAVLFSAVKLAGRIIERQMGMAMAEVMDPLSGERSQPLGSLIEMIFVLIFLAANGHHMLLIILNKSYEAFPAGQIPSVASLAGGAVEASSMMLSAALRISAPILAAFIILMVTLAILARVVPEMNILFISFPLRVGMGLLMVAAFFPLIAGYLDELTKLMSRLIPI